MGNAGLTHGRHSVTTFPRSCLMTRPHQFASCQPLKSFPDGDGRQAVKAALPLRRTGAADPPTTAITDMLVAHGVEIERVHKRWPAVFRYDVARLQATLQILSTSDLDPAKVIRRHPEVLKLKPEVLASNLAFLQALLIDANKAVESCPQLLIFSCKTIQSKLNKLTQLGLPADKMVKSSPFILIRSDEAIHRQIAFLHHLGLKAKHIVARFPLVIGLTEQCISAKISYLKDVGLDAVRLLNAQPQILSTNIDRNLRPTLEFLTKDMGRSLEEININPVCLTCSLEKRIKPRHRYMMAHGRRKDFALGTLLNCNDERFAWIVARQPMQHYQRWLQIVAL